MQEFCQVCVFFCVSNRASTVFFGRFCQRNCGWFTKISFRLEGQMPRMPMFWGPSVNKLKVVGITSKILVSSKLICFEILEVYGIPSIIRTLFGGFNKIAIVLSCFVTPPVLALSTRVPALACSALACSALTPMHFPGVHPSRYVYLDLDSGGFYWNRKMHRNDDKHEIS